jgi:hypothetical protein
MDISSIIEELIALLNRQQVEIRRASLGGNGSGLCRIRGKNIFFFDNEEEYAEIASKCASAVAELVDIETVYIKPELRDFIKKSAENE